MSEKSHPTPKTKIKEYAHFRTREERKQKKRKKSHPISVGSPLTPRVKDRKKHEKVTRRMVVVDRGYIAIKRRRLEK